MHFRFLLLLFGAALFVTGSPSVATVVRADDGSPSLLCSSAAADRSEWTDEQVLKGAGVATDGRGLLDYLRGAPLPSIPTVSRN